VTRYQVRVDVVDRPGVLAQVAAALADHHVSIEAVRQSLAAGSREGGRAPHGGADGDAVAHLVLTTHSATDAALAATVEAVAKLDAVLAVRSVLRVEGN
jgi:homoserine dehydrogenase